MFMIKRWFFTYEFVTRKLYITNVTYMCIYYVIKQKLH